MYSFILLGKKGEGIPLDVLPLKWNATRFVLGTVSVHVMAGKLTERVLISMILMEGNADLKQRWHLALATLDRVCQGQIYVGTANACF